MNKTGTTEKTTDDVQAASQSHAGGCHCGKVRYEVETSLDGVLACNCSICAKRGTLLTFVPAARFTLQRGEADLSDYQFNKHHIHHLFCATCGVASFARGIGPGGAEMVAVNVRCLDDVDPGALTITHFDGKSL
jgi:hypothetical protein